MACDRRVCCARARRGAAVVARRPSAAARAGLADFLGSARLGSIWACALAPSSGYGWAMIWAIVAHQMNRS
uniref:Uncharacterized protein n=1 Tax=Oryza glumipatula TaxID=40148 RepID=A0A0E0ABD0_9ORYZ